MSQKVTPLVYCIVIACVAILSIFLITPASFGQDAPSITADPLPHEDTGLVVDCSFTDCEFEHVFELANRIVKVLIWIATTGVVLVIVWHGIILAMNAFVAESPQDKVKKAQKAIQIALLGLVLALGAHLIVDFFFRQLGYKNVDEVFKPPADFQAPADEQPTDDEEEEEEDEEEEQPPETPPPSEPGTPQDIPPLPNSRGGAIVCSECVSLSNASFRYKTRRENGCSGNGDCYLNVNLRDNLARVRDGDPTLSWRVTEAWPPTVPHDAHCHKDGTCADVNFHNQLATAPRVNSFIELADRYGLRVVYEVLTDRTKDALVEGGVPADKILVLEYISASHFSVYLK